MKPASSPFFADVRKWRIVFHRPADFLWTLTIRLPGPVTRSESRSPTEVGDSRAAFQPTTFVDFRASLFACFCARRKEEVPAWAVLAVLDAA